MKKELPESVANQIDEIRPIVKELLHAGEAAGKYWAASWIENAAKENPSSEVKEFAANMAMSIRASSTRVHPRALMELPLADRLKIMSGQASALADTYKSVESVLDRADWEV